MMPPGRGQFEPQGHGWQDLWRGLLNIKYLSFGFHGFREEDFFSFSPL